LPTITASCAARADPRVVLSMHGSDAYVAEALRHGAIGCVV
jgi:DNA-binding NarL/FixJ family response regulator